MLHACATYQGVNRKFRRVSMMHPDSAMPINPSLPASIIQSTTLPTPITSVTIAGNFTFPRIRIESQAGDIPRVMIKYAVWTSVTRTLCH